MDHLTANSHIAAVPFIAKYETATDKYQMQTAASAFAGTFNLAVNTSATYAVVKPADQTFYVGQDPATTTLSVTVTKNNGSHGLTKDEILVTSSNTSVLKATVSAAATNTATLTFEPITVGSADVTVSVKDAQGLTSDAQTFSVEVKDEGIRFAFYAADGTTSINKLDIQAGGNTAQFIVRATKNGTVQQTGTWAALSGFKAPAASATQVIEEGFGRLVTIASDSSTVGSEGELTAKYTSAETGVTYADALAVRSYRNVTFGTLGGTTKESLGNGVASIRAPSFSISSA